MSLMLILPTGEELYSDHVEQHIKRLMMLEIKRGNIIEFPSMKMFPAKSIRYLKTAMRWLSRAVPIGKSNAPSRLLLESPLFQDWACLSKKKSYAPASALSSSRWGKLFNENPQAKLSRHHEIWYLRHEICVPGSSCGES